MGILQRISTGDSSRKGIELAERGGDSESVALIGFSRGNSYFKRGTIGKLAEATREDFSRVAFMLPDKPSVKTLEAQGYGHAEAEKKANLSFNGLRNIIRQSLDAVIGAESPILRWQSETPVEESSRYQESLEQLKKTFQANEAFRKAVLEETKAVVLGKYGQEMWEGIDVTERGKLLAIGKEFLLMEFACIVSAWEILGAENVMYIYHRPMGALKMLLDNNHEAAQGLDVGHTGTLVYSEFQ